MGKSKSKWKFANDETPPMKTIDYHEVGYALLIAHIDEATKWAGDVPSPFEFQKMLEFALTRGRVEGADEYAKADGCHCEED